VDAFFATFPIFLAKFGVGFYHILQILQTSEDKSAKLGRPWECKTERDDWLEGSRENAQILQLAN
jgi:hypothetical protein